MTQVKIEDLTPHPNNPRRGDIPAIMRSLERFGQVKPVIVQRSTGYIVAGNHVTQAAARLGWDTVEVEYKDMDDETALGYLLADNRTADRAGYDKGALYKALSAALTLDGTGFDDEDLEFLAEDLSGKKEKKTLPRIAVEATEVEQSDAPEPGPEPLREVPLRMTSSQIEVLGKQVIDLQDLWQSNTLVEVVLRSVKEAHERWQAHVRDTAGKDSSSGLPAELVGTEY